MVPHWMVHMDYDSVANYVIMNQLCKVCGEPAAGFHFGAFTCEGCKSFFGRTYNNVGSISECKNNGRCVINKKNRTACKACRLRKCVMVGMSKSGSRYGRRSNWFKIHCLLQQQQQQQQVDVAGLLRPHPHHPYLPTPTTPVGVKENSESDSGASSADPEDEVRSASAPASDECFSKRRRGAQLSPASLPSVSPGLAATSANVRWLPPLQGISDPSAWRDLWLRGPPNLAAPAPDQEQPIDLSVKQKTKSPKEENNNTDSENEMSIDVGEETVGKASALPLDLTLER